MLEEKVMCSGSFSLVVIRMNIAILISNPYLSFSDSNIFKQIFQTPKLIIPTIFAFITRGPMAKGGN
ncbi:3270_t:CDS:1, partial [Dentiscutata erythropus]